MRPALLLCLLATGCTSGLQSSLCGADTQLCCGGQTCNTGFVCGPDAHCSPCGGESQTCCEGTQCGPRMVCSNDTVCHHCGGLADTCCPGANACVTPLLCNPSGRCELDCTSSCTVGARRCAGAGIEGCQQTAGACPTFASVLASCASAQTCEGDGGTAECVEKCPGACLLDSFLCTTVGNKKCALNSGAACPTWEPAAAGTGPICTRGACTSTGLCWESPTPLGSNLVGISGWAEDQFFVLDHLGNIVRNNAENWTYEVRADPARQARAIATCDPGSSMATGDNGLFLRRSAGTWNPENIGDPSARLRALGCDSLDGAMLAGAGGKIFIRSNTGTWTHPDSGTTVDLNAVAYYFAAGKGRAFGQGGIGILCAPLYLPATLTCSVELDGALTSGTLQAAVTDPDGATYAVGENGLAIDDRRPAGWWVRTGLPPVSMRAVTATHDYVFAVGQAGTLAEAVEPAPWRPITVGSEDLNAVFSTMDNANNLQTLIAAGAGGSIWIRRDPLWLRLGGGAPVKETLNAVRGLDASDVWAVGAGGAVYHRADEAWVRENQSVSTEDLNAVVPISPNELYAFGNAGTVIARRNGAWSLEAAGVTNQPLFGATTDGKLVYAVGAQGVWLEKTLGTAGSAWTLVNHAKTTAALNAVVAQLGASGALEVNAVGAGCSILTRKATGFTVQTLPMCFNALLSAWEGPNGELYVAGENAWLSHRDTAAGSFVREYPGLTLENIYGLTASGTQAWAVASSGQVFHRLTGAWRDEEQGLTSATLKSAWLSGSELYVVGSGGLIWHRQ